MSLLRLMPGSARLAPLLSGFGRTARSTRSTTRVCRSPRTGTAYWQERSSIGALRGGDELAGKTTSIVAVNRPQRG